MKRILFLFAGLVALSTTAFATTTTSKADASINNYVRGYGNSFIFTEAGIEFSVYADGQFDFYMLNYGPDVSVGYDSPGFSLSFNSGYDYNPYVQYDSFGAILQIENTQIYYDYYGRVNQIGNIFIRYNGHGRINRVGGLNVSYRNNVFLSCDGFINSYNRAYIYRPWHRFYTIPSVNFCIININPYRQYYTPERHIYYRPYTNNVRYFNSHGRHNGNKETRQSSTRIRNRYTQQPRNNRERIARTRVKRANASIATTRATRLRESNATTRVTRNATSPTRSTRTADATMTRNSIRRASDNVTLTDSKTRVTTPTRSTRRLNVTNEHSTKRVSTQSRLERPNTITRSRNNVTRIPSSVSNKLKRTKRTSVRKPKVTKSRIYNRTTSLNKNQQSTVQNKSKSLSVKTRSNDSRKSGQSSTRSNSRQTRG